MTSYEVVYLLTNAFYTLSIFLFFRSFFQDVRDMKMEGFTFLLYYALSSLLFFTVRVPIVNLLFTVVALVLLSMNYRSSWCRRLVVAAFICAVLLVFELLVLLLIGFVKSSVTGETNFDSIKGLIAIRFFTMMGSLLMYRVKTPIEKDPQAPRPYYPAYLATLVSTSYLFVISLLWEKSKISHLLLAGMAFLTVNTVLLVIDKKIVENMRVQKEKSLLKLQNIAYENQNEIIMESYERVRSLRHDIKNHLLVLKEMQVAGSQEAFDQYIGDVIEGVEGDYYAKSQNFVIDSIVNFKLAGLKDSRTDVDVKIRVPHTLNILAYDLTVILGNLLDNAITALDRAEVKRLNLHIGTSFGNLVIFLENSYDGKLILKGGRLRSTKAYGTRHGYGLVNVENVVEKYGGDLHIDYTSDLFSVKVLLPFQE